MNAAIFCHALRSSERTRCWLARSSLNLDLSSGVSIGHAESSSFNRSFGSGTPVYIPAKPHPRIYKNVQDQTLIPAEANVRAWNPATLIVADGEHWASINDVPGFSAAAVNVVEYEGKTPKACIEGLDREGVMIYGAERGLHCPPERFSARSQSFASQEIFCGLGSARRRAKEGNGGQTEAWGFTAMRCHHVAQFRICAAQVWAIYCAKIREKLQGFGSQLTTTFRILGDISHAGSHLAFGLIGISSGIGSTIKALFQGEQRNVICRMVKISICAILKQEIETDVCAVDEDSRRWADCAEIRAASHRVRRYCRSPTLSTTAASALSSLPLRDCGSLLPDSPVSKGRDASKAPAAARSSVSSACAVVALRAVILLLLLVDSPSKTQLAFRGQQGESGPAESNPKRLEPPPSQPSVRTIDRSEARKTLYSDTRMLPSVRNIDRSELEQATLTNAELRGDKLGTVCERMAEEEEERTGAKGHQGTMKRYLQPSSAPPSPTPPASFTPGVPRASGLSRIRDGVQWCREDGRQAERENRAKLRFPVSLLQKHPEDNEEHQCRAPHPCPHPPSSKHQDCQELLRSNLHTHRLPLRACGHPDLLQQCKTERKRLRSTKFGGQFQVAVRSAFELLKFDALTLFKQFGTRPGTAMDATEISGDEKRWMQPVVFWHLMFYTAHTISPIVNSRTSPAPLFMQVKAARLAALEKELRIRPRERSAADNAILEVYTVCAGLVIGSGLSSLPPPRPPGRDDPRRLAGNRLQSTVHNVWGSSCSGFQNLDLWKNVKRTGSSRVEGRMKGKTTADRILYRQMLATKDRGFRPLRPEKPSVAGHYQHIWETRRTSVTLIRVRRPSCCARASAASFRAFMPFPLQAASRTSPFLFPFWIPSFSLLNVLSRCVRIKKVPLSPTTSAAPLIAHHIRVAAALQPNGMRVQGNDKRFAGGLYTAVEPESFTFDSPSPLVDMYM
ncbi:hypothetical protein DFH06DRAFT_1145360 [Mycena polygramma]|nr:hypothetical protein DFH06DRAFT_1145360 [Mycena polygramma]